MLTENSNLCIVLRVRESGTSKEEWKREAKERGAKEAIPGRKSYSSLLTVNRNAVDIAP